MLNSKSKTITFTALICTSMIYGQSDSLESDYTLGRITGPHVLANQSAVSTDFTVVNTLINRIYGQVGRENKWQLGGSLDLGGFLVGEGNVDGSGLIFGSPGFNWVYGPTSSNRISADVEQNMLYGSLVSSRGIGWLEPYSEYLTGNIKWDFLSNSGVIIVDPKMYDLAFFCGPQANKGQFGFQSIAEISGDQIYGAFADLRVMPVIGITDNLQVNGLLAIYWSDYLNYPLGIRCDYRLPWMQLSGGCNMLTYEEPYYHEQFYQGLFGTTSQYVTDYTHHTIFEPNGELTFLSSKHIESINQVRGNWDGYFSDQLGTNQFLSRSFAQGYLEGGMAPSWQMKESVLFGLLPQMTLGLNYSVNLNADETTQQDLAISTMLSNIPLREQGPSEVSKFDYVYGFLLKPGEFKGKVRYCLPVFDTRYYWRNYAWNTDVYYSLPFYDPASIQGFKFRPSTNRTFLFDALSQKPGEKMPEEFYNFSLKATAGLGSNKKTRAMGTITLGLSNSTIYWGYNIRHSLRLTSYYSSFYFTISRIVNVSSIIFGTAVYGSVPENPIQNPFNGNLFLNYQRAF